MRFIQGEDQKKLDVVSNDVFCNALRSSGRTGTIASEEEDVPVAVEETNSGDFPSVRSYNSYFESRQIWLMFTGCNLSLQCLAYGLPKIA